MQGLVHVQVLLQVLVLTVVFRNLVEIRAMNVLNAIKASDSGSFEIVLASLRKMNEHIDMLYRLHN